MISISKIRVNTFLVFWVSHLLSDVLSDFDMLLYQHVRPLYLSKYVSSLRSFGDMFALLVGHRTWESLITGSSPCATP